MKTFGFVFLIVLPSSVIGATMADRQALAESRWRAMPASEQAAVIAAYQRFEALPPTRQKRLRENFSEFQSLPEARRREVSGRWKIFEAMTPAQRVQVLQMLEKHRAVKMIAPRSAPESRTNREDIRSHERGSHHEIRPHESFSAHHGGRR